MQHPFRTWVLIVLHDFLSVGVLSNVSFLLSLSFPVFYKKICSLLAVSFFQYGLRVLILLQLLYSLFQLPLLDSKFKFFPFFIKLPRCFNAPSVVFSVYLRIKFLLPNISSSSLGKLYSIHCHIIGLILQSSLRIFFKDSQRHKIQ